MLLLEDLRDLLDQQMTTVIFTTTIIEVLVKREDRPWPEYRHDKPISARGVASLLGRFGIKPRSVRIGEITGKGYRAEDLAPVFRKYLPKKEGPLPVILSVTSVTPQTDTPVADPPVTDVTDRKRGMGGSFSEGEEQGDAWEQPAA
jgi:hypothetical protein